MYNLNTFSIVLNNRVREKCIYKTVHSGQNGHYLPKFLGEKKKKTLQK